ncbi:IS6 family transposase [Bacillus thuringiensis]|nr:IS6 family transposase [Bacillus thuringiensis]
MGYFKGKQFERDIILIAVGYYCRFSLSYRDVSEILKEHGISVPPTTIMRWVHEYRNLIYQIWKKKNKTTHLVWHLDETYIKVKREWRYLYRAIDGDVPTLDIQLRRTRDHQAAYMFMKRLVKAFGEPSVLTTGKAPALLCAFKKWKKRRLLYTYQIRVLRPLPSRNGCATFISTYSAIISSRVDCGILSM